MLDNSEKFKELREKYNTFIYDSFSVENTKEEIIIKFKFIIENLTTFEPELKILKSNLKGKNLLDLYCGVGTLGLSLKDNFESRCGIEKIENAIIDAKENALINNCHNAHFYTGDTYEVLKDINVSFDTIIVDPPRSGLNEETRNLIIKLKPDKLCYVSCDPFTLARDLNILNKYYDVEKINALDMFPNTYHVECFCILERTSKSLTN